MEVAGLRGKRQVVCQHAPGPRRSPLDTRTQEKGETRGKGTAEKVSCASSWQAFWFSVYVCGEI